ncbi:MAG TPA: TonB-dependent receptor [Ideonella sp.]|uniref:TonB-dependent receptor domain-containing protein n=1 Tax=Ideonella sp. TaxID=1929293 RepID=UPI002E36CDCC|nr:TonB-dependent receptor [Ideonella sp.]HEX5684849.1 TonB-dependent receptor [Ideonella sp.]
MPHRTKAARPAIRRTVLALACASLASAAWSQEDTSQPAVQKIEVTGSRIKRIDAEGTSPVTVLRRESIQQTGATTISEALATLTSSNADLDDLGGSNSFAAGASSASMRGLGKQSTLVLLNGRRISAFPLADYQEVFSNLDTLPLDAVDRIEVLKSGGSSIYGSDAVAGVINIITRSSYQGLQARVTAQQSANNGEFQSQSAALTGGFGDMANDGYNVLANVEFYHRDSFFWQDLLGDVNPKYRRYSPSLGAPSTYSYPGNVNFQAVPGCTNVNDAGQCLYDRATRFEVIPPTERTNMLVSGHMRLGEDMTGFAELLYSRIEAAYNNPYALYGGGPNVDAGPTVWGNPTTGDSKTFYYRMLPVGHPLNPTDEEAEFQYRFVDAPSDRRTTTDQYRFLAGVQGVWSTFDWEVAGGVMGGRTKDVNRGTLSDSGFKAMIGDYKNGVDPVDADFFNKPNGYRIGQKNSKAVLDTLFPSFGFTGETTQTFLDGKVSGDIAKWAAGNVGLATGFDLRHEKMKITPDERLATGDIVGYGVSSSDASRTFGALFAEVSLPIFKTLEAQVAGRIDHFPGFPTHFSPKLGMRFQPIPELLFRGTFEGGFRAPNLTESAKSTKFAFAPGISDPQRCDQAGALADDLAAAALALPADDPLRAVYLARADAVQQNECGTSIPEITANNPKLKPETSKSFTLGLGFQPIRHWSGTVDYWRIYRKDEIGLRSIQEMLSAEASQPAGTINRAPLASDADRALDPTFQLNGLNGANEFTTYGVTAGAITSVHDMFLNLLRTKTSGLDLSVKGEIPTPAGPLSLDVDTTYTIDYRNWSTTRDGWGDNLAGRYGTPRWVVNVTTGMKTGDFGHSLRYVWNSSTSLQSDFDDEEWTIEGCADARVPIPASDCKVRDYHRWDYSIAYSGIKDFVIGLNVRNLFNQRPPADLRALNFSTIPPDAEDVQGRMLKLSLQYKFM